MILVPCITVLFVTFIGSIFLTFTLMGIARRNANNFLVKPYQDHSKETALILRYTSYQFNNETKITSPFFWKAVLLHCAIFLWVYNMDRYNKWLIKFVFSSSNKRHIYPYIMRTLNKHGLS